MIVRTVILLAMVRVTSSYRFPMSGGADALYKALNATVSVLEPFWTANSTHIFIFDGSTPPSSVHTVITNFKTPSCTAIFEASSKLRHNQTWTKLSTLVEKVKKLKQTSRGVQMTLISDDEDFLTAIVLPSKTNGLLRSGTRLLIITRLLRLTSFDLIEALSNTNSMVITLKDDTTTVRCGIYIYMPFINTPLRIASWNSASKRTLNSATELAYLTEYKLFPKKFQRLRNGPVFKVAAQGLSPYLFIKRERIGNVTERSFYGPSLLLLDLIAQYINFKYILMPPPDGSFGSLLPNGSWNGMIGMVVRKEVDFALGPFAVTYQRALDTDLSNPLLVDQVKILGRRGLTEVDPWGFALPLTPIVWASSFIALIILISIVSVLSQVKLNSMFGNSNLSAAYIRAVFQQDITVTRPVWWDRLLLGVWLLSVFVIIASYKTNLMSLLAVRYISEPYQTWRDMVDDESVQIVSFGNTAQMQIISAAKSGIFFEVAEAGKRGRITLIPVPGFVPVVDRLVSQGDHVFLIPYLMMKMFLTEDYMYKGNCKFYGSREGFMDSHLSLVLQKNSQLLDAINEGIRGAVEGGLYHYWLDNALPNVKSCKRPPTKITVKEPLSLANLWGMFVVLVAGYVISILVFILEKMSSKF